MSDPRYSSKLWRRTRRQVLERDAFVCQIRGPRCTGVATTCDHINPVALGGEFYAAENLRGACVACNSGRGAAFKNQRTRIIIAQLQETILEQSYEIEQLRERLARYERPELQQRQAPAIY